MKKLKKTEETEVTDVDRHYFPPYIWLCRSYIRLCHPPLNSKPDFCSNQAHNSDGKEHLISENAFFCYLMKLGSANSGDRGTFWTKRRPKADQILYNLAKKCPKGKNSPKGDLVFLPG